MKSEYRIQVLCDVLEVSVSGYYDWRKRQRAPSTRSMENQKLLKEIQQLHQKSRTTYGSPRIFKQLQQMGHRHSRKRIARLMKENFLRGVQRKRWRIHTTNSKHHNPIAPNLLLDRSAPSKPNEVWVSDITYVPTKQGWLYVAGILDLYSRRIVGWAMGERLDASLVLSAWNMAVVHRLPTAGLIHHSDRGVQYTCADYRKALSQSTVVASMSRRANCYDNATMESFWATLKTELIHQCDFENQNQARQAIFDYIETFYNRERLHSALDFKSPVDFENQNN